MPSPNLPLWYIEYFKLRALEKQQMQREVFSTLLFLPKDRSSERNSVVLNPLTQISISQERLTLVTGEETRSRHHTRQTLSQTMISPISSCKGPFIFHKIIYSSLRGLHSSSSSPSPVMTYISSQI